MDLSKFRKIKESEHSAVLQHPDGHRIMIAKKILSPKMNMELSSIPIHKAEGGEINPKRSVMRFADNPQEVPDQNQDQDQNASYDPSIGKGQAPVTINIGAPQSSGASGSWDQPQQNAPMFNMPSSASELGNRIGEGVRNGIQGIGTAVGSAAAPVVSGVKGFVKGINGEAQDAPQAPASVPDMPSTIPASQTVPIIPAVNSAPTQAPSLSAYEQYKEGVGNQLKGIDQGAQADSALGRSEAAINKNALEKQQAQVEDIEAQRRGIQQNRDELLMHYSNQHIDPMRIFHNMGTGQRILTSIGLLLGGLSSGFNHGVNPALNMMNTMIDRDIASQKEDMGKGKTLLEANQQELGNLNHATEMTRIQMQDAIAYKMGEVANQAKDPKVKALALQNKGIIQADSAQKARQLEMQQAMFSQLANPQGQAGTVNASNSSGGAPVVDPDNMARRVQAMGMSGMISPKDQEEAEKEIKIISARQKALALADENIKEQAKIQTVYQRTVGQPLQGPAKLDALHAQMTPLILDAAPSKRLTPEAIKSEIAPYNIDIKNDKNTVMYKLGKLKEYINQQSDDTPKLRGLGLLPRQQTIKEMPPVRR